ncbi:MAG: pyridoxal phosphate-dependent transferase [Monoraphidium minutum]|nr:MAG: pyridoxal phosphate-dependent transferase [Monoraphidium minutum]
MAAFLQKDACVLFPSGWTACMAAVKGVARQGDLILMDAAAHDCLRTGARLSRATVVKFKSADPGDLERLLRKHRHKHTNALIVTEAIFSVDGAVLPEAAFSEISRRHGCRLLVDVAHALGVWGAGGRGLDDVTRADIIVGTFSKSFVTAGGFAAAGAALAGLIATTGLVTTANMSNAAAAAALAALRLVRREPARVAGLRAKIAYARARLASEVAGLGLRGDGAVIHLPVDMEHDGDSVVAWRLLMAQGVYCQIMCYPAVAPGQAGPRFAITSAMTTADIDHLVTSVAAMWHALPAVRAACDAKAARSGSGGAKGRPLLARLAGCIGRAAAAAARRR